MDRKQHGLIIDLNRYRPSKSLKQYLDAGADGFILRIGGPSKWIEGDYAYQEDPTWRYYMDQAKALGITHMIGGYIVHNPFEEWRLQGVVSNVHINLLNQWTSGGYMPGYLILDHEINCMYRGATKITITVPNLVASLNSITDQIWKTFKKVPMIYTGRWFVDQNGPAEHMAYLDNVNRAEKQRPMWYAAYNNPTAEMPDLKTAIDNLPVPTSTYISKYLQCGSYSLADLWQFTDRLRITGDATGVDASVTMGTLQQYWDAVGVTATVPTPPPPPPPVPGDNPDLTQLTADVAALKAQVASLSATVQRIQAKAHEF